MILSTGMSTSEQIKDAVKRCWHTGSDHHACHQRLSLRSGGAELARDPNLKEQYPCPIGYSGHEVGLITSVVAVSLGACLVERHFTLDRSMWGGDQAASVERAASLLVKYIRVTEMALGDGVKRGLRLASNLP
jgi:N-acetylneuraminate synthase